MADDSDYSPDEDPSDDEECVSKPKKSIPDDILWNMFRTGVSFPVLSEILKLSFSVLGEKENFNLSQTHLFKKYQRLAAEKETKYQNEIRSQKTFGTFCFDNHKMKQLSGKFTEKQDRLALIWHCNSKDKLLSIDTIQNKSGRSQFEAIQNACQFYEIRREDIVAVTSDNASTNTGNESGTIVHIEEYLDKPLLRLMCRHHIMEIVLKHVYRHLFSSDTPTNLFYPILLENWSGLKDSNFPFDGVIDEEGDMANMLGFNEEQYRLFQRLKDQANIELQYHYQHPFIRDDYKEITNVSLKFLNGARKCITKSNQVQFNTLQNPSNARFMASAIQGINCFLFRNNLNWDGRIQTYQNLKNFGLFLTLVYVRYWNRANILFEAGLNDLNFIKELEIFSLLDQATAQTAINAISEHLYYLSEELITLSLFSEKLSTIEKNEMAATLLRLDQNYPERDLRSNHVKYNENVDRWQNKRIVDFVGDRSLYLFRLFEIPLNFLSMDCNEWPTNHSYLCAKEKIMAALVCVNDNTERVISTCKFKYKRQRCKNNTSFQRSMFEKYM